MKSVLVIKTGALGDIVRTGMLVKLLKFKYKDLAIYWYVDKAGDVLVNMFPDLNINIIGLSEVNNYDYDAVLSLEESGEIVSNTEVLYESKNILFYGFFSKDDNISYTLNTSAWNDMGLLSRFNKNTADILKKQNSFSFLDIWCSILRLDNYRENYELKEMKIKEYVVISPWAGERWPSKSLCFDELLKLCYALQVLKIKFFICGIVPKNINLCKELLENYIDTSSNLRHFIKIIKHSKLIITADSLALHISNLYGVPSISFFTSTSAHEIDVPPKSKKIISLTEDYCSYKPNADNKTITSIRIVNELNKF